ncbi:MAG: DsrE family protein [Halomonas sp.]|nr:DsrE family protein [Halomonas sp.]
MSETVSPILIVLRHAPHGSSWLKEGLDVALVGAALGQPTHVLFLGQGVEALIQGQQAGPLGQKGTHPTLDMLAMYDIETLLVDGQALAQRGLALEDLQVPVTALVEEQDLPRLFSGHSSIFMF